MIQLALEVAKALDLGHVAARGKANGQDEPTTTNLGAVGALDQPLVPRLVKDGRVDVAVVLNVLEEVPLRLDVLEVALQLLPVGVPLLERKVLVQLGLEELVDGRVAVYPRARVLVPVPDAAACGSFLEDFGREALLA